jgi:glutamyl-tRNA synthetase
MGWLMPDGREEFTLQELIDNFTLESIALGGPIFDLDKLTWLNGRYLRNLPTEELLAQLRGTVLSDEYLLKVLPLARERVDKLEDFVSYAGFFFTGDVEWSSEARARLVPKKWTAKATAAALDSLLSDELDPLLEWQATRLEALLRGYCEKNGWKASDILMSVRVAVTGKAATPPLFETMEVLGREVCRRRVRAAVTVLKAMPEGPPETNAAS